jgi:hypothetical protein
MQYVHTTFNLLVIVVFWLKQICVPAWLIEQSSRKAILMTTAHHFQTKKKKNWVIPMTSLYRSSIRALCITSTHLPLDEWPVYNRTYCNNGCVMKHQSWRESLLGNAGVLIVMHCLSSKNLLHQKKSVSRISYTKPHPSSLKTDFNLIAQCLCCALCPDATTANQ